MDTYGLIGKNLSHSFSPDYFKKKFQNLGIKADYKIFELNDITEFPKLIANNPDIKGLNVTIPYKRSLSQFMDFVDEPVKITGSINTIKIQRKNNKILLSAYNTDVIGFEETIVPLLKKKENVKALILGSGGSANSVAYVLRKFGIEFSIVSRNPSGSGQVSYQMIDKEIIKTHLLIINTTPIGMYPDIGSLPQLPYDHITDKHILYDLIYNPSDTLFLQKGREHGATCINGLKMLEIQADASWSIWNI